ncbi:hypothetical protein VMCG_01780 [Cytospora schulzeri]|uniref:Nephrocystin 3-like N-terminal domain-containing protein n=1 Tax=Cytospora schulzeri TaxID=448051 RepID=A0A423X3B2_9PEZI|nr:hypothetical protein VMCG_01780 [Valsa malicola]
MADPLGTTASLIAVLQVAAEVVKFINSAAGAINERKRLREEIRSCMFIIERLKDDSEDVEEGEAWTETLKTLGEPGGPLDQLSEAFSLLKKRLAPKYGLAKVVERLKWPLEESDVSKMCDVLERQKSLLNLALSNDCRKLIQAIKKDGKETILQLSEMKQTLSNIEATQSQSGKDLAQRVDEVKSGVARLEKAHTAGAGKTIIWSLVAEHLQAFIKEHESCGLALTAFDYRFPEMQLTEEVVLSIAQQFLVKAAKIPGELRNFLVELHERINPQRPNLEEALDILGKVSHLHKTMFVVIDALDECQENLQSKLVNCLLQTDKHVRVFCTSRPIPRIRGLLSPDAVIVITAKDQDLQKFILGHIQDHPRLNRQISRDHRLQDEIIQGVVARAKGM